VDESSASETIRQAENQIIGQFLMHDDRS